MAIEQHPALDTGPENLTAVTLALPADVSKDQVVQGVIQVIGEARGTLEPRASLFQQRTGEYEASGQRLRQALRRGQFRANLPAIVAINEAIIGASSLWPQYETAGQAARIERDDRGGYQVLGPGSRDAQIFSIHDDGRE
ncbi:MAG TPA: hypothetical protein VMV92_11440 [Streptosporangiaceae bacterium]|nr:hypothetical protein [Streptosporangiaceae bacterium]